MRNVANPATHLKIDAFIFAIDPRKIAIAKKPVATAAKIFATHPEILASLAARPAIHPSAFTIATNQATTTAELLTIDCDSPTPMCTRLVMPFLFQTHNSL